MLPQALAILDAANRELARKSFLDFITYTKPNYKTNWHHSAICQEAEALITGETTRLILCAPPRHGKSEIISRRFPAYLLGKDPDAEIIACSHNSDLASSINRDVQRIIDSPEYVRLFPETRLFGKNVRTLAEGTYLRNSNVFEVVNHNGSYKAAGIRVGITGFGSDYAIVDDPFRSREEANSEKEREKVWEWFTSSLYTRLSPNARIIIIMTRWHEDDLAGRLIAQMNNEGGEPWRVVSFPAFAETSSAFKHDSDDRTEGVPLWLGRFGNKELSRIKAVLGSYEWSALYQQRPSPAEGAIFLREWWRQYNEKPQQLGDDMEEIVMSWDLSFKDAKDSDYVVGQVWGRLKADRYLLDQVRARMDFPATLKAVWALKSRWPEARKIYIEDAANGPAVIASLKREIQGLIPVNPEGGKVARANAVTGQIESGNVYLPPPVCAPWIGDFIEECSAFPNGAHDDQVDAMTQALNKLADNRGDVQVFFWRPENW